MVTVRARETGFIAVFPSPSMGTVTDSANMVAAQTVAALALFLALHPERSLWAGMQT